MHLPDRRAWDIPSRTSFWRCIPPTPTKKQQQKSPGNQIESRKCQLWDECDSPRLAGSHQCNHWNLIESIKNEPSVRIDWWNFCLTCNRGNVVILHGFAHQREALVVDGGLALRKTGELDIHASRKWNIKAIKKMIQNRFKKKKRKKRKSYQLWVERIILGIICGETQDKLSRHEPRWNYEEVTRWMRRPDGSCRLIRRHPGLDQPGFETPPNAQIKEPMQVHLGTDGSLELVSDFCRPVPTSLVPPGAPWRPLVPPGVLQSLQDVSGSQWRSFGIKMPTVSLGLRWS